MEISTPIGFRHSCKTFVAQDSSIINNDIYTSESIDGSFHDIASVGHRIVIRDCFAT